MSSKQQFSAQNKVFSAAFKQILDCVTGSGTVYLISVSLMLFI